MISIKGSIGRESPGKSGKHAKKEVQGMAELLPICLYDESLSAYRTKENEIVNLWRIQCKDLGSLSTQEIDYDILLFTQFYRKFSYDMKLVCLNMPENCQVQIHFLEHKISKEKNSWKRNILEDKKSELEWLEKNRKRREYYIMTFAKNETEKEEQDNLILADLVAYKSASEVSKVEKDLVLAEMMNQGTRLFLEEIQTMDELELSKIGYDPFLLKRIQPAGGISFRREDCNRTGNGYNACLTVYDYPAKLPLHWLSQVTNQQNTMVTVDISTEDQDEVRRNLNKSFREQRIRHQTEREDGGVMDASDRYMELKSLRDSVNLLGEIVKLVTIRVFLQAADKETLDKQIGLVSKAVDGKEFKASVFLSEQKMEWQSLLLSYQQQKKLQNFRYGQPLTSKQVAEGNPFHFSFLSDPFSIYMGQTKSGGSFNFSLWTKTKTRLSYNAAVYGKMGAGKTTLLKKLGHCGYALGDNICVFDPSGEWESIGRADGAIQIDLSGSAGMINQFEIQRTDEMETTSYMRHISKMTTLFRIFSEGSASKLTVDTFEKQLRQLYVKFGIIPKDGNIREDQKITGLPANRYPTMSDFVAHIIEVIDTWEVSADGAHEELAKQELVRLDEVRKTFEALILNYGYLFDGYTCVDNIMDQPFVIFNVASVLKMKPSICNAVLFNALMLVWDKCTRSGMRMKKLYEEGKIRLEDVVHLLVLIDEWWHLVNQENIECLMLLSEMMREMRKYFGGILLASQNVSDNITNPGEDDKSKKIAAYIKALLALCTYKFIGLQDTSTVPDIKYAFKGVFTEMEIDRITKLGMSDFILAINNEQTVEFKVYATEQELKLFTGGL